MWTNRRVPGVSGQNTEMFQEPSQVIPEVGLTFAIRWGCSAIVAPKKGSSICHLKQSVSYNAYRTSCKSVWSVLVPRDSYGTVKIGRVMEGKVGACVSTALILRMEWYMTVSEKNGSCPLLYAAQYFTFPSPSLRLSLTINSSLHYFYHLYCRFSIISVNCQC